MTFNILLNAARSKIEHAFGVLKGRFRSLTMLRCRINVEEDVLIASMYISACVVLHNILVRSELDDPYSEQVRRELAERLDNIHHNGGEAGVGEPILTNAQARALRAQGVAKRSRLMEDVM